MTRVRKQEILELPDHHTDLAEKLQTLERHLNQLEDQLIRAQRLAAMGTMATMIAHEFNNIMTPVVSYTQYALGRNDVDLMKKALEKAFTNGKEATEVCQQLLGFARGDAGTKSCDVAEVVQGSLRCLVRNPAKDNITLQLDIAQEKMLVEIEPCLLQQVVYNLILNARDAMLGRPGRLKVIAQVTEDPRVQIQVCDSGCGIDPEVLPRIFDPFFTTKTASNTSRGGGGSGLGLAISKNIITRANGTISVQSEPGKGTTFTITLPRMAATDIDAPLKNG